MKVFFTAIAIIFCVLITSDKVVGQEQDSFGSAVVDKVGFCEDLAPLQFRCDIKNYPPIVGRDIVICIAGVSLVGNDPNSSSVQQAKEFVSQTISNAEFVQLRNMRRGESFCIVADVYCEKQLLANVLIEKGYAKQTPKAVDSSQPIEQAKTEKQLSLIEEAEHVGSKSSKVFHKKGCKWTRSISQENIVIYKSREEAIDKGKRPCKACNP